MSDADRPGSPQSDAAFGARDERRRRPFRLDTGVHRVQRDVDEEMAFHLAMREQKLIKLGLTPAQAREEALKQFGDVATVRTECISIDRGHHRAMNRLNHLQDLRQDITYAIRALGKNKGFAFITVLILALGIGANTAIFSLLDALLLRQLPVANPRELVVIGDPERLGSTSSGSPRTSHFSAPLVRDVQAGAKTVTGVIAVGRAGRLDVLADGAPANAEAEHPVGRSVSGNYFNVLGVRPLIGRVFTADEDKAPGTSPVVVLGYDYWKNKQHSDPQIVGRVLHINKTAFTVIGVTPQKFKGEIADRVIDLYIPLGMHSVINANTNWLETRNVSWLMMMARRAPGVSVEQVRAEMQTLVQRSVFDHATANEKGDLERDLRETPVVVESAAQGLSFYRSSYRRSLYTLMAAVALVLLVVCANVANLLLARATARAREMSVRMALGAKRLRLVQQLLTESLIIALAGGALGTVVAVYASRGLLALANGRNSGGIILDTGIDARLLAFGAGLSLFTALLFGVVPALSATRVDLAGALRAASRNVAGTGGRFSTGRLLVVAQVALSVLLLAGTGMLLRSLQRLNNAEIGADRDKVVIASLQARRLGYDSVRTALLMKQVTERLRTIPGVIDVSVSMNGVFSGSESGTTFRAEGFTARNADDSSSAYDRVGAHYFRSIGARLRAGRDFEESDNLAGKRVAIVNETFAKHFFPNGSAIGRNLLMDDNSAYEIVGVVADVNGTNLRAKPESRFYLPMAQDSDPGKDFYLQIRTTGDPLAAIAPARSMIAEIDRGVVISRIDVLNQLIDDTVAQDRLVAQVVSMFGLLTLVLSALGLYGVMAYATVRRTNEFGLRLALGALPARIVGMVLREAWTLTVAGVIAGLPLAFGMSKLLRDQLYGLSGVDVPSIAISVVVLGVAATLAGFLPARRASQVAPLDALRSD